MKFYHDLGFLIFGSRLRRMSEYYISEINRVYKEKNIEFEAAWFPVFYLLSAGEDLNLREIANTLQVSHSAISQLIKSLKYKGLVSTKPFLEDRRQIMVSLTDEGKALMDGLKPVWKSISDSMGEIYNSAEGSGNIMPALNALENYFEQNPLSDIILNNLNNE